MATVTYKKGLVGKEDVNWHDPSADGTTSVNFSRTGSTGAVNPTKPNASHLAVLSPALFTGGQRPFLKDLTAAQHSVEKTIENLRRTTPYLQNFEAWGGKAGDSSTSTANKNSEILEHIVDNIVGSTGANGGIFFPAGVFYFNDHDSDTIVVDVPGKSNLLLHGMGPATQLQKISGNDGKSFFRCNDCSRVTFAGIRFNNNDTTGGGTIRYQSSSGSSSYLKVLGCEFVNVFRAVWLAGGTDAARVLNAWVQDCVFTDAGEYFVYGDNVSGVQVTDNRFAQSLANTTGIKLTTGSGTSTRLCKDNIIAGNNLSTSSGTIEIAVPIETTSFSSSNHSNNIVRDNVSNSGSIAIMGDRVQVSGNTMGGSVTWSALSGASLHQDIVFSNNRLAGAGVQLVVSSSATPTKLVRVLGNSVLQNSGTAVSAILFQCTTANFCSRFIAAQNQLEWSGTTASPDGITVTNSSTGGHKYVAIIDNQITGDATNKLVNAVRFNDAGASGVGDWVVVNNNFYINYITAGGATFTGAWTNKSLSRNYQVDEALIGAA